MARIRNVDILDDRDPLILVQEFVFDDRTLLVFRKPTEEDQGEFFLSPGVEVDRSASWVFDATLMDTAEDIGDPEILEQFALIYRREDVAPTHNPTDRSRVYPYAAVVYDPEADLYRVEDYQLDSDELGQIAEPSFEATLTFGVFKLHDLLNLMQK